ncbi:MAG TPA: hypothetical protein VGL93_19090 [Streptosporangiaceae bacterium]
MTTGSPAPRSRCTSPLTELFAPDRVGQGRRDGDEALALVRAWAETRADQERVIAAFSFKCDVLWSLLDAVELVRRGAELDTGTWARVFAQDAELGVVQAHVSGGEPLLRPDQPEIVAAAHRLGLTAARLSVLTGAGLNAVQLSVQDAHRSGLRARAGPPPRARGRPRPETPFAYRRPGRAGRPAPLG